jgi:hypothetical protein
LINSVGNIGGLVGPSIYGSLGLPAMALTLFAGGLLAVCIQHDPTSEQVPPAEPDPRPLETGIKAQSTDIWAGRSGIREADR